MSDTPTPAQADEKARGPYRAEFGAIIHEDIGGFLFTVSPPSFADDVAKALNTAAIRPEVEPVADPDRILKDALFVNLAAKRESAGYRGVRVEGGRYASIIFRIHEPDESLGIASPPAPAVKVTEVTEALDEIGGMVEGYDREKSDWYWRRTVIRLMLSRLRSALLPPEEAQAAAPAEALPSQTSGAEAGGEAVKLYRWRQPGDEWSAWFSCEPPPSDGYIEIDLRTFYTALAKPASEPAGGGVVHLSRDAAQKALSALDSFMGDTDPLEDTPALLACQALSAALSSPASSSPAEAPKRYRSDPEDGDIVPGEGSDPADYLKPAEAEALPAGVEAGRLGEMIYRALYEHEGGIWAAVDDRYKETVWNAAGRRLAAALSAAPAQAGSAGDSQMLASASVRPEPSSVEDQFDG